MKPGKNKRLNSMQDIVYSSDESNYSDSYNCHGINDQLVISQHSEYLQKHVNLKDSQEDCQVYAGSPSCSKIPH